MKSINLFSVLLFSISFLCGCKKETNQSNPPNPNPTTKPAISLNANLDSVPQGSTWSVSWTIRHAYFDGCTLNGQRVDTMASHKYENLQNDLSLVFRFEGKGGKDSLFVTKHVYIVVGKDPKPTISFSANLDSVPKGSNWTVSWSIHHAYFDGCTLNGQRVDTTSIKIYEGLQHDLTLLFKFEGKGGKDSLLLTKHVFEVPPMTVYQIFTQPSGFKVTMKYRLFPDGYRDSIPNANGNELSVFGTDGNCYTNGDPLPWSLLSSDTQMFLGYSPQNGKLFNIVSAIPSQLTLSIQEMCYSCQHGATYIATYIYTRQ